MRIALCQMDPTVGDIAANADRIESFAKRARAAGAELAVFPELALIGYPPRDLLIKDAFIADELAALDDLAARVRGIAAVVGFASRDCDNGRLLHNSAAVIDGGRVVAAAPQAASAHLRRLRRGALLLPAARNAGRRPSPAGASASPSARTPGTTPTSGACARPGPAKDLRCRPGRGCRGRRRRDPRQPLREPLQPGQGAAAARDVRLQRGEVPHADRLRQPGRRQRRAHLRRPQPCDFRAEGRVAAACAAFEEDMVRLRHRGGAAGARLPVARALRRRRRS